MSLSSIHNHNLHSNTFLQIICLASVLILPRRHREFPIYLLVHFIRQFAHRNQRKMQSKYRLIALPNRFYAILTGKKFFKSDHYIIVSEVVYEEFIKQEAANWINVTFKQKETNKVPPNEPEIVASILKKPTSSVLMAAITTPAGIQLEPNCLFISENCYQNFIVKYKLDASEPLWVNLQELQQNQTLPELANKATIFLINQPHEIASDLMDEIIGKFFEAPQILYRNHTYEIRLAESVLGNQLYAKYFHIFSNLRKLYFRCVHLESKDNPFELSAVVAKNLTSLQQTTSINMAVPKQQLHDLCCGIRPCPNGLMKYFEMLRSSLLPFVGGIGSVPSNEVSEKLTAFPLFLLQGNRGSGKTTILNAVAQDLGLQIYGVDCVEIVSQIPSQTEAKVKIVLSKANLCEPLIIALYNFEIFGVDNEGREDLRILAMFQAEVEALFAKERVYPVILIGITSEKNTKPLIQRLFLDTIRIDPLNKDERFDTLQWLHTTDEISEKIINHKFDTLKLFDLAPCRYLPACSDLVDTFKGVADKTPGFMYGDLRLLYENSRRDTKLRENQQLNASIFEHNLAEMQSSFADSLGAPKVPKVLWSDIGGLAKLKDEIQTSIGLPLKHIHLMGKNLRRSGILLYGPPGTGKTLVAKAVATECNLSFLSVQGPELLNMYVGQSEQNVREVFARARSAAPCVIFLDELDSLAPNRGVAGDSGGVMDRVVSQLMTEMNGLDSDPDPQKQIFILAATNRPDLIDPSLLRPGRFDKLLYVGPCTTTDEKVAVLEAQMKKFTLDKDLTKKDIADMLHEDMTGADLYSICSNAWLSAVRRTILQHSLGNLKATDLCPEKVIVNLDDFQVSARNFVPSVGKKDMEYFNKLKASFS